MLYLYNNLNKLQTNKIRVKNMVKLLLIHKCISCPNYRHTSKLEKCYDIESNEYMVLDNDVLTTVHDDCPLSDYNWREEILGWINQNMDTTSKASISKLIDKIKIT